MRAIPGSRLRIEGNCDERGTIEYNLALDNGGQMRLRQLLFQWELMVIESRQLVTEKKDHEIALVLKLAFQ